MVPLLPPDEVHIWTATREAPDDAVEGFRALLTDDERARADRFASAGDRRQFAVGRGLLRTILGRYLGREPGSLRFVANAHGKPGLDPALGVDPALRFNLAHSGTLVLYAITRGREIGVDIEKVRPDFGALAIASRFFAPAEVDALLALPAEARTLAFFHGWTRKEAYIKAQGKGLALPLDEFEVAVDPDRPAALLSTSRDPAEAARWSLVALPTEPGYVAAACVEGSGWTLRRGRWPAEVPDSGPPGAAMKYRPSISELMTIIFVIAVYLGLDRSRALGPWGSTAWLGAMLLLLVAQAFWFVTLPRRFLDPLTGGDSDRRRRLLEIIAATPSLFGPRLKIFPNYLLLAHHLARKDLDRAEATTRALLGAKAPPGVESSIRRRLADALETAGRVAEAEDHRRLAAACLDRPGKEPGPSEWMARGKLLERSGRHREARDCFERGLGSLARSGLPPRLRVEFLSHLALANINVGEPAEAVRRAEESIAAGAAGRPLISAHRIAGLGLGEIGRLDEARAHRLRALELAEAAGDRALASGCLAQLADIERRRGRLDEADLSCRRAEALGGAGYELYGTWYATLRAQGRLEEAAARLRQAFPAAPLPVPASDRRLRGSLAIGLGRIEADLGLWAEAEARCREARALFGPDPKLLLMVEAAEARVAAGLGRRDEAAAAIDRVEARLAEFPADRSARIGALASIGPAAQLLGDFGRAESLWALFEEAGPDPVDRAFGFYHLGEARLGLGRLDEAREAFRLAVAEGIDTHHARLARARLESGEAEPSRPIP